MSKYSVEAILKATGVDKFVKGFQDAKKSTEELQKSGKTIGKSMETVGSSFIGAGKSLTAGFTAPVIGAVGASIKSFADLEQAVGGIETMFKSSADAVIKNSESAYRRAGVSGVQYMENVTSFSATLLQGLGGDTEEAAKYADTAMVDMADNANKFGTNIESVQDAYQGFAKDNYTMLDNLKLGYGGTAGEMARLVNESGVLGDAMDVTAESVKDIPFHTLVEAIHEVQTEMDVTGTTALEAEETVSGSFGTMIAAAQNLAAGLGDPMADVEVLFQVLGDTVVIFVDNIKRVLGTMWDNLPLTDFQKWVGVIAVAAGPLFLVFGGLLVAVGKVFTAFSGATSIMGGLSALFPALAAGVEGLGAVFTLLTGPIGLVIAAIAAVVGVLVYLYQTNEEFRAVIENIWLNIQLIFQEVTQIISDILMMVFETLSVWWQENQQGFMDIVMGVWTAISDFFIVIFTAIGDIINAIWQPISDWYQTNQEEIKATIEVVWNAISSVFMTVMAVIGTVIETGFNFVSGIIETVMPYIEVIIDRTMDIIMNVISLVMGIIRGDWSAVWDAIKNILINVWTIIKTAVKGAIDFVLSVISSVMSSISSVWSAGWDGVLSILTSIWDTIRSYLSSLFDSIIQSVIDWVGQFAPNIADGLQSAYDTVKGWANNFLNAGENIVKNIANGIKGGVKWVTDAIGSVTEKIRDFLPFSPPKDKSSPLVDIHKNGITEQIAKGIYDGEGDIKRAMNRTLDVDTPQINGQVNHSVNTNSGRMESLLEQLVNSNQVIVLDSGELVGATYSQYDRVGGNQTQLTERWGR